MHWWGEIVPMSADVRVVHKEGFGIEGRNCVFPTPHLDLGGILRLLEALLGKNHRRRNPTGGNRGEAAKGGGAADRRMASRPSLIAKGKRKRDHRTCTKKTNTLKVHHGLYQWLNAKCES